MGAGQPLQPPRRARCLNGREWRKDGRLEMRVLLRQTRTKLYYDAHHQWTTDARSALDFDDVDRAVKCGRQVRLPELEVVLAYDDPFCDLILPVRGCK